MTQDKLNKNDILKSINAFYYNIDIFEEVTSTNDIIKNRYVNFNEGCIVISDTQSRGRGKNDKPFFCTPGKGIYMSILLKPLVTVDKMLLIVTIAAIATVEAIKEIYNIEAKIKWVNDIYIGNKKVAGILCESSLSLNLQSLEYLIMGIGINVHPMDFPQNLSNIASSIEDFTKISKSRNELIVAFLKHFYKYYSNLENPIILKKYREYSNVLGKSITVYNNNTSFSATALDINEKGYLIIKDSQEKVTELASGDITIRY